MKKTVAVYAGVWVFGCLVGVVVWAALQPKIQAGRALSALKSKDPAARLQATMTLARLKEKGAIPKLVEMLNDSSEHVRVGAALALMQMGEPAVKPLSKELGRQDQGQGQQQPFLTVLLSRQMAVSWILQGIGAEAVPELLKMLSSQDMQVFASAFDALGRMGEEAVPPLARALKASKNPTETQRLVQVLGRIGKPAVNVLMDTYKGTNDITVKMQILSELGGIRDAEERVVTFLLDALSDPNLATTASEALGRTRHPKAVDALIEKLKDPALRRAAARGLGWTNDKKVVPLLIPLLQDKDKDVAANSAQSLGMLGDERAIGPLIKALGRGGDVTINAAYALARFREKAKAAVDTLIPLLQSKETPIVIAAIWALRDIGDPRARPHIQKLVTHPDNAVRQYAHSVLEQR